jgi:hypothetical protein
MGRGNHDRGNYEENYCSMRAHHNPHDRQYSRELLISDSKTPGIAYDIGAMAKERHAKDEKPWSTMELFDLRHAIEQGEQTASVLRRSVGEVLCKAEELGLIHRRGKA